MRALVFRTGRLRLAAGLLHARATGRPATAGWGPLQIVDLPDPSLPGERWVRVRTRLGAICGSDLRLLRVEVSPRSAVVATRRAGHGGPMFPGHEVVGEVLETGPGVDGLSPGQRVALIPGHFCAALEDAPCACCARGLYSLCQRRSERSEPPLGGGWSEQFVRHQAQFFPVPPALDDETAALIEPLACSLHAVLRRPPPEHGRVLVLGAGIIGLGIVAVLRALGRAADVTVLARHAFQTSRALDAGADRALGDDGAEPYELLARTLGTAVVGRRRDNRLLADGFDVVYDCVGSAATLHDALRWCRPRGFVVLAGLNLLPGPLDRTPLWHAEVDLIGAMGHGHEEWEGRRLSTFERVTEWLVEGRLRLRGLLTHRFALTDYRRAIATASDKGATGAIRVAFDFRHGT